MRHGNGPHGNGGSGRGTGTSGGAPRRTVLRRTALPASALAALAAVTAAPAAALAAPAPAPAEDRPGVAEPVPCPLGVGDEDELAAAFRRGGTITLHPGCTYTVTRRHGTVSALPPIERDTVVEGQGATIRWDGTERVPSLFEIGGGRVRLDLRDVRLKPGEGMTVMRIRRGSSVTINQTSGGREVGTLRGNDDPRGFGERFEEAKKVASMLFGALGEAMRAELEPRQGAAQTPSADDSRQ